MGMGRVLSRSDLTTCCRTKSVLACSSSLRQEPLLECNRSSISDAGANLWGMTLGGHSGRHQ